jgi:hypothetical protein
VNQSTASVSAGAISVELIVSVLTVKMFFHHNISIQIQRHRKDANVPNLVVLKITVNAIRKVRFVVPNVVVSTVKIWVLDILYLLFIVFLDRLYILICMNVKIDNYIHKNKGSWMLGLERVGRVDACWLLTIVL